MYLMKKSHKTKNKETYFESHIHFFDPMKSTFFPIKSEILRVLLRGSKKAFLFVVSITLKIVYGVFILLVKPKLFFMTPWLDPKSTYNFSFSYFNLAFKGIHLILSTRSEICSI